MNFNFKKALEKSFPAEEILKLIAGELKKKHILFTEIDSLYLFYTRENFSTYKYSIKVKYMIKSKNKLNELFCTESIYTATEAKEILDKISKELISEGFKCREITFFTNVIIHGIKVKF